MHDKFSSVSCLASPGDDSFIYALFFSRSDHKEPIKLMVIDKNGKIVKQKIWQNLTNMEDYYHGLKLINNIPYILFRNIGSFKLTKTLENVPDILNSGQNNLDRFNICADLNNDGFDEWIFWDAKDNFTIYNEKVNERTSFESPIPITSIITIYPVYKNNEIEKYMFTTSAGYFFLEYKQNENYYFLYIIYLLAFLTFAGTIRTILFFQKKNIEKKWHTEKQLSNLQFNAVKNQLDPHFLFNALNSVALLISEGEKEEAYDFLSVNSRMIRRVMDDAEKVKRSLKDELQFTKDYIHIQQHRFKERFNTEINVQPEVNLKFEVPKMCIHTYVENAIKHGFKNTISGGILKINLSPILQGVSIVIEDNGMGNTIVEKQKKNSGNGIEIMNKFYKLFEKYYGYKIQYSFIYLKNKIDKQTGTRIILKIQNKKW